jgi:hypothetical protein
MQKILDKLSTLKLHSKTKKERFLSWYDKHEIKYMIGVPLSIMLLVVLFTT